MSTPPSPLSMPSSPTASPPFPSPPTTNTFPFISPSPTPGAAPAPRAFPNGGPTNESAGIAVGLIIGVVVGALTVLIVVGIFVILYRRMKRKLYTGGTPSQGPIEPTPPPGNVPAEPPSTRTSIGYSLSKFTFEDLALATDNFSDLNLVGRGGFGFVHKGVLKNGKVVAIKQLKAGSGQGEREFQAEVDVISRVHHRHLVSLVGYCIIGDKRLLVYEFVPNNSLEFHLHGTERPVMNWSTRIKIALGVAKGLAYLHEDCRPKIIHRDIKAANILLDDSFEAKVADFGLAKFSLDTNTPVSTRVVGTFGYMAPEYASSGKLTEKSDVFSFGVVLLELITGRRPVDMTQPVSDQSIVNWARPLLSQALENINFDAFVDPRLQKEYDSSEMTRMVACAAACVRRSERHRPRMSQIVRALEGNMSLDDLNGGITPGDSAVFNSYGNPDCSTTFVSLESQELGSSENSGLTGEYKVNPFSSSTEGQHTTQEMEMSKETKDTSGSS